MANFLKAMFGNYSKREVKRVKPLCDKVLALESKYQPMSDKELKERLEVAEKEYLQTKINHSITPLDNPSKITKDRRMIARMKTELRARELKIK